MAETEKDDPFAYAHGRDDIVWMSQNTNTIPTHPLITEVIIESVRSREYNLYPYKKGIFGLPEAILRDIGLEEQDVLITNGGIEALYIANRALLAEGDEVIASDPSFLPIHRQVTLSKAKMVELPVYEEPWKLTAEKVNEAVTEKTKMILLIDPLNPLGSSYGEDEVKAICDIAADHNLYLVDDITYRDFADEHHLAAEFYPERTITVYSFSKNCGLAGMRIGALIAPHDLMEEMMPYNTNVLSVNVLAQRAALAALETKSQWMANVLRTSRRNQQRIKMAIEPLDGVFLPVYPSMTNMFAIDVSELGLNTLDIQNRLLYRYGIFVRDGRYVSERFGDRFIRVSFSVPEKDCERFVAAFPAVIRSLSSS